MITDRLKCNPQGQVHCSLGGSCRGIGKQAQLKGQATGSWTRISALLYTHSPYRRARPQWASRSTGPRCSWSCRSRRACRLHRDRRWRAY